MPCRKIKKEQSYNHINLNKVLTDWYDSKGNEVQLDGASSYTSNPSGWINFIYNREFYKLNGDTKDIAVKEFLDLFKSSGGDIDQVLTPSKTQEGNDCLKLESKSNAASGWYCYKT